jgi:hypothetical protein
MRRNWGGIESPAFVDLYHTTIITGMFREQPRELNFPVKIGQDWTELNFLDNFERSGLLGIENQGINSTTVCKENPGSLWVHLWALLL